MRNIKNTSIISFLLLSVMMLTACRKTEFMPDPEGAQVPYQSDATQSIEQLLLASPAKIFYAAWQRSTMKARLEAMGKNTQFTVFVPDDAALTAAGITNASIAQMAVNDVDSLLMFYTSNKVLRKEQLGAYSIPLKTLLEQKDLYMPFYESDLNNGQTYDLYFHRLYLATKGDELLIYGKSVGKLNYQPATNGAVYFISKAVERPTKTVKEVLEADTRFSIFLGVLKACDELYLDKISTEMEMWFGYRPSPDEIKDMYKQRDFFGDFWGGINRPIYQGFIGPNITMNTLFAPTDEAFKNAGFQSVADVMRFNEHNNVRFDDMSFSPEGNFPTDTLFNYHYNWGRMFGPRDPSYGLAAANSTMFYSNDLRPEFLSEYYVNIGGTAQIAYAYKMPFGFSVNGTAVQLKIKDSTFPAANVVQTDINTLNGPIHAVDHLLIPKGFKFH